MGKYVHGWIVASEEYKRQMREKFAEMEEPEDWSGSELREMREERTERIVQEELQRLGKGDPAIALERKGVGWKVAIAARLRRETPVTNPWIARRLNMGHATRVSNLLAEHRKQGGESQK